MVNMKADTTGTVSQAQNTNDSTANLSENSTIAQLSKVGSSQSAASGTLTQSNNRVVPAPAAPHWDPAQSQTLSGQTHSTGQIFIPITSVFTDINHFIQTITVTAQNVLSF